MKYRIIILFVFLFYSVKSIAEPIFFDKNNALKVTRGYLFDDLSNLTSRGVRNAFDYLVNNDYLNIETARDVEPLFQLILDPTPIRGGKSFKGGLALWRKALSKIRVAKGNKKVQFSKHATKRMLERGITKKMVETGITKGTKYFDIRNGTFNYVLKNGFSSGKDLLIGVSPQTGKVVTVLRGNNLINKNFIPQ